MYIAITVVLLLTLTNRLNSQRVDSGYDLKKTFKDSDRAKTYAKQKGHDAYRDAKEAVQYSGDYIKEKVYETGKAAQEGMVGTGEYIKDKFFNVADSARDSLENAKDALKGIAHDAAQTAREKAINTEESLRGAAYSAKEKISHLKEYADEIAREDMDYLNKTASDAARKIKETGKSAICSLSNMAGCPRYVQDKTLNQRLTEYILLIKNNPHYANDLSAWLKQKLEYSRRGAVSGFDNSD